jgi:hypothetical protein
MMLFSLSCEKEHPEWLETWRNFLLELRKTFPLCPKFSGILETFFHVASDVGQYIKIQPS